MLTQLKNRVLSFWNNGHERTLKIKRNVFFSFLIKGASVVISFLLVPLTIHYVNTDLYGVWLTIFSVVSWINTFDIGLSNGLRNKLANAIALNEKENIVKYISTTYALLLFITLAIFCLFFIAGSFFNWNQILRIPETGGNFIWPVMVLSLGLLCVQFVLQPINSVLIATHQPYKSSLMLLTGQLLTLVLIFVLLHYTHGNLFILAMVVSGSPVLCLLFGSFYFYKTELKYFKPGFGFIDFKSAKNLINLGGIFFFIQIGALVLYETDNIIITRILGPSEVTTFNIAFKYFSILTTAFVIIITPYWSAFTDAYTKHEFEWMKSSTKKLMKIWLYFSISAVVLYFFSDLFYQMWIGDKIIVPNLLSISMCLYVMAQNWTIIYAYMLNGTGKLRIQLIMVISTSVVNIPLSVFLIGKIGISGTTFANTLVMIIMNVFLTYQCKLILNRSAIGIWNK